MAGVQGQRLDQLVLCADLRSGHCQVAASLGELWRWPAAVVISLGSVAEELCAACAVLGLPAPLNAPLTAELQIHSDVPTDPVTGPTSERTGAAATANRWLSPAKTMAGALAGCVAVIAGLAASHPDVALLGVTWLALLAAAKFMLAVFGNAYMLQEQRYQRGFYASLFGTDSEARHGRPASHDPDKR